MGGAGTKIPQGGTNRIDPCSGIAGAMFVAALNPFSSFFDLICEQTFGGPINRQAKNTSLVYVSEEWVK
jgi:hypothetical protein